MAKQYNQNFKDQILVDMKQSGLSVYEAAKKYQVNANTIYRWLDQSAGSNSDQVRSLIKENRQLKREVKMLCSLVKKFSAESAKKKT